jgi:hypothetical protein
MIVDNDIFMSAPEDAVFASNSAAIQIGGPAPPRATRLVNNRIRGRAATALMVFQVPLRSSIAALVV